MSGFRLPFIHRIEFEGEWDQILVSFLGKLIE